VPNTQQKQNTQKVFKLLSFAILALLLALPSAFAINQLMPLHGRVTSSGSSLSSGDLQVIIYDANTLGNIVYNSGSDFNGAVSRGIVDVMLGSTTQVLDLNYGTYYYMDINVNGVNLDFNAVDRKKFESNRGDDLNVNSLGSVTSVASSRLWLGSDGNVGVGVASPSSKFIVFTTGNARAVTVNNTTGNVGLSTLSTPGFTLDLNGTFRVIPQASATNALLVGSDGNVGVNASSATSMFLVSTTGNANSLVVNNTSGSVGLSTLSVPGYTLDVNGTFRVLSTSSTTGLFQGSDANVAVGTTSATGKFIIATSANGNTVIVNNTSGNVGIATLSAVPAYTLDVNGGFRVASTGTNGLFQNSADANVGVRTITPTGVFQVATAANSNTILVNNTSGNVGIATLSAVPAYTLDVNGTFRVASSGTNGLFQGTDGNVGIGTLTPGNKLTVVGDLNVVRTVSSTPSLFVSRTDGNVGIGTTTPFRSLGIVGDVNVLGTVYATAFSPSNQWAVSGTNIYYTTGNVGANTTVPNNKLTVVGDFNVVATNAATPSLFVTTDGNVGINTKITSNKLNLIGDLNVATSATATPSIYVNSTDGNVGINMASRPANRLNIIGDLNVVTSASAAPSLFVSPTDGNIGIAGIAASTWRLDVTGSTRITGYTRLVGTSNLLGDVNVALTAGTGAPALFISGTDRNVSVNNAFGTNKLTLVGDLNVTPAGTGSPSLFVHPTDGNVGIARTPGSTFRLDVSGYTRFSSGDVNVQGNKLIVQDVNSLNKIYRREAPTADACMGIATLGSTLPAPVVGSAVTVTTTCVTANSRIFLTRDSNGTSATQAAFVPFYFNGSRIGGTSFDINSSLVNDANQIAWMIIEPA